MYVSLPSCVMSLKVCTPKPAHGVVHVMVSEAVRKSTYICKPKPQALALRWALHRYCWNRHCWKAAHEGNTSRRRFGIASLQLGPLRNKCSPFMWR